jgi:hypothetical protein
MTKEISYKNRSLEDLINTIIGRQQFLNNNTLKGIKI